LRQTETCHPGNFTEYLVTCDSPSVVFDGLISLIKLTLNDIRIHKPTVHYLTTRTINDSTILEFQLNLSYESWDNVFNGDDVDTVFNNFLNMYLKIYNHAFPLKKCQYNSNNKPWITPRIKISSQRKRELYLLYRSTTDSKLKNYYKRYCRILSDVIKNAKKL